MSYTLSSINLVNHNQLAISTNKNNNLQDSKLGHQRGHQLGHKLGHFYILFIHINTLQRGQIDI